MPQSTTWDRRLYFRSEGRLAEDFFAIKIRRLRPCLNRRTRVPEASTLTPRPPKPLTFYISVKIDLLILLTLREEYRLRVSEKSMLRMFGPKREEVTGDRDKMHNT